MHKQALLHGRKINIDSDAFVDFAIKAYQAENLPSQINKKARSKSFVALVRANNNIIKQEKN